MYIYIYIYIYMCVYVCVCVCVAVGEQPLPEERFLTCECCEFPKRQCFYDKRNFIKGA